MDACTRVTRQQSHNSACTNEDTDKRTSKRNRASERGNPPDGRGRVDVVQHHHQRLQQLRVDENSSVLTEKRIKVCNHVVLQKVFEHLRVILRGLSSTSVVSRVSGVDSKTNLGGA